MKPLDPRLLRRARAARRYVLLTTGLGALTAALVVGQALLLAHALAPVVRREADLADVAPVVAALGAVVLARALVVGVQERWAHRAALDTVAELRGQVVGHAAALGPRWLAGDGSAVTTLATRGLDALEPYFVRYLPQLLLAVTVTPATLAVVLGLDWVAAATVIVTIPLVPVFMALVGRMTQDWSRRRLEVMRRLGAQVLDLLTGLPTLRALGREVGPGTRVRALGDAHRRATMSTLRVAFLSGMVLELLTTLSVALVAVGVGMRLVHGGIDLTTALAVLVLAPEVYLPLRQVGAHFHASTDGIAAAEQAFAVLEEPLPSRGRLPAPDLRRTTIHLRGVTVHHPGRTCAAPLRLDATVPPGRVLRLVGANGSGKSTAVAVLLGLVTPDRGRVTLRTDEGEVDLVDVDPTGWWAQVAWVPQRTVLTPGTVRELVTGGRQVAADDLRRAAGAAGLTDVLAGHPDGWDRPVGQGGQGLSVGERQRVALARALLSPAPLVVLDEPTAHLDAAAAAVVARTVAALRTQGRTVVLVAHDDDLHDAADLVVTVGSGHVTEPPRALLTAGTLR